MTATTPKSRSPLCSRLYQPPPRSLQRCVHHATAASVSPTHRPGNQKNVSSPTCNAIPTAQLASLPTSVVGRPRPNPHS